MTELSAEACDQAMAVISRCSHGYAHTVFGVCVDCIARALAEKDAALAEARRERDEQDGLTIHMLRDALAAMEVDLATMRGVLEWLRNTVRHIPVGIPASAAMLESLQEAETRADIALASSPGAAWLATAREVIDGVERIASDAEDVARLPETVSGESRAWKALAAQLRALLARPEVRAWAGLD